ncbi:BINDING PROTEIN putative-RELATED [Salix koriyanagi]|uniref:BINDING PROTEIN putative-RELATED n=1 Tax=Salix koriyanagi TaxID=2511006 RepID=A0A9Q0SVC1_9ROSI|nr:BINDING PROTEIN putative-RELATED [Salix koriyanagi]
MPTSHIASDILPSHGFASRRRRLSTGFVINKMISAKKLIKLAKKWQKLAALRRRRIALPQTETSSCRTSEMADKGHFVVYSTDQKRFLLPLNYLKNEIVRELLQLAEEEFGLPSNGPLTLPCDAELIEYVVGLIKQGITRDFREGNIGVHSQQSLLVVFGSPSSSSNRPSITNM